MKDARKKQVQKDEDEAEWNYRTKIYLGITQLILEKRFDLAWLLVNYYLFLRFGLVC